MSIFFKKTVSPVIISKKLESAIVALLKKISKYLNYIFIIAFVACIFVTGASTIFTQCSAEKEKNVDKDLADLRQRQSFIDTFDNKIEQYIRLTYSPSKRKIFIGE